MDQSLAVGRPKMYRALNQQLSSFVLTTFITFTIGNSVHGEDWPTLRHDQRRGGVSGDQIEANKLSSAWSFKTTRPPVSAWPDAAKWDAYAKVDGLRSMRDYDPVFHPIVVDGKVYLPSNVDDTVRCLTLKDGRVRWQFTADGPVRIAPSYFQQKIYFGSDDGSVYCVDADDGSLIWKREIAESVNIFINDGRLCSMMPVRTGVLIDESEKVGIVSAGLFPWHHSILAAFDLESGELKWKQDLGTGWTLEGAMLLSPKHIVAPQGRSAPQLFDRATGKPVGALPGGGGSFVLLTEDEKVFHGPGNKSGWITESNPNGPRNDKGEIEKVASFDRGTAVVVRDRLAYLLDQQRVAAFDRVSGEFKWVTACPASYELILVGNTLYAGGDDEVWAFDSETGDPVWKTQVDGRAMGLAAADGHLLVATDTGQLACFTEGEHVLPAPEKLAIEETFHLPAKNEPTELSPIDQTKLLYRWVFHRDQVIGENLGAGVQIKSLTASEINAPLPAGAFLTQEDGEQALLLDGRIECEIAPDFREIKVPSKAFTVEAVVSIEQLLQWGGLVSITQDNGDYEKGWILGYRDDKFGFAVNGIDGPDRLVWITDQQNSIETGRWYHVAATYDGEESKLYVNGQLVASSTEPKGEIRYPEKAAFHIGAYKDDDEHFIAKGMLNEVAVFERACGTDELAERARTILPRFPEPVKQEIIETPKEILVPPTRGPVLRFISPGVAEVNWWTSQPQGTRLELIDGNGNVEVVDSGTDLTTHRAMITNLKPRSVALYQIVHQINGGEFRSEKYECDSHFDYTRRSMPESTISAEVVQRAKAVIDLFEPSESRGLALICGCDDEARLAEAFCRISGYDVCLLEKQTDYVEAARKRLVDAGVYGRPINIRSFKQLDDIRLPQKCFDLVFVASSSENYDVEQLAKYVQPGGRLLLPSAAETKALTESGYVNLNVDENLDCQSLRAPRIAGSAGWTHMYGTPENSAYAGETLSGVRGIDDVQVAWAGRPGPRYQSDRGNRKPSPLAAGGRLYLQGLYRTIAVDAYNGTILWSLELPEVVRFNVPRDCSNWCVDEANVYIASDERCIVIDGATGKILSEYVVSKDQSYRDDSSPLNWGYIARQSSSLIGTGVRPENSFTEYWGGEFWYDSKDGEHAKKVCSENIFSVDPQTGTRRWDYDRGLIVNPTITISGDQIYFVECRSKELMEGDSRRLDGEVFWNNLHLVALDLRTGKTIWETPAKPMQGQSAFYLLYADKKLLMQSSQGGQFALYAIDAENGKGLWRGLYAWQADHHGKHLSRPAVVEQTIYLRPLTLSLADGSIVSKTFPDGHQCGTYTCSKDALFMRAGSLAVWDRETAEATRWDRLRPDCWISTIPAEGMLLSPEGGGGCSCGGWIETSIGFAPKWDQK